MGCMLQLAATATCINRKRVSSWPRVLQTTSLHQWRWESLMPHAADSDELVLLLTNLSRYSGFSKCPADTLPDDRH